MPDRPTSAETARVRGAFAQPTAESWDDLTETDPFVQAQAVALGLDAGWLFALSEACLATQSNQHMTVLRGMRAAGVDATTIAERYVPAAARVLGEQWCTDAANFGRVTVGCSRLHRILREISAEWRGPEPIDPMTPSLLVVVEGGTYHTLGATVLSGALRRRGFAVRLMTGTEIGQLSAQLCDSDYAAVLISASGRSSLEMVRKFVELIHDATSHATPVVVGGPLIKDGVTTSHEVLSLTGADHCTDDPNEALRLCGLTQTRQARAVRTTASNQRG